MCGITGVFRCDGGEVQRSQIEQMLQGIAHRGPDGSGIWCRGPIGLGHVRLSILDLSAAAAQPMVSLSGRSVITYNGEVYNFADLRAELGPLEVPSTGDTAVIVEYLERFGVDRFVERAEGFYAIGLWDVAEQTLTLMRDHHGIKPLYMRRRDNELLFASEMGPVSCGLDPDPIAISSMMAGRALAAGNRTIFRGLEAVAPGEIVTVGSDGSMNRRRPLTPEHFYDEARAMELASADDATLIDEFDAAFRTSVRMRMTSDAPVACLASGGIDSSLVAVIAKQEGFDLPLYHADVVAQTERPAAEALARHLGADLIVERTTDDALVASLAAATYSNELPLTYHLNAIPFFLLSRRVAADGVKVILTGEGSDEYLLGYPQYGAEWAIKLLDRVRQPLRRAVRSRTASLADSVWFDPHMSTDSIVIDLLSAMEDGSITKHDLDLRSVAEADRSSLSRSLELVNGHLVSLLHRNDRLGMAWGLESRFPFLGHDLSRFCLSGPARIRLRGSKRLGDKRHPFVVDKWVVREVARRHLPVDLVERPKMGFPVSIWQRTDVNSAALNYGLFAEMFSLGPTQLEAFAAKAAPQIVLRAVLVEAWMRVCVERTPLGEVEDFLSTVLVPSAS